jgi:hypothetical protein
MFEFLILDFGAMASVQRRMFHPLRFGPNVVITRVINNLALAQRFDVSEDH